MSAAVASPPARAVSGLTWELQPGVFLARLDRRSVVLSLRTNRYLALNERLTTSLLGWISGDPALSPADLAESRQRLLAAGVATSPQSAVLTRQAPTPVRSLWPSPAPAAGFAPFSWREAWAAGAMLSRVAIELRARPFRRTLDRIVRDQRAGRPPVPTMGLQEVLDGYAAARPWFPVKPICRLEALSLALRLARRGHRPDLVFGVRLDPFHAHCWVQVGDRLVNESVDDILQYTPILTLGPGA